MWKAVTTFIQKVISVYYKSDDDVSKDIELQAWVQDMHDNGFPVRESGIDHEFPTSLATRDKLLDVLTCVVFTCSCQHAAMTFGLLEVAGFVPNSPFLMRHPPPTKKEETTLKSIMETLPNKSQAASDIIKMIVRTRFPENEVRRTFKIKEIYILAFYCIDLYTDTELSISFQRKTAFTAVRNCKFLNLVPLLKNSLAEFCCFSLLTLQSFQVIQLCCIILE